MNAKNKLKDEWRVKCVYFAEPFMHSKTKLPHTVHKEKYNILYVFFIQQNEKKNWLRKYN